MGSVIKSILSLVEITVFNWRANLVKDFFPKINFPTMRALEFISGHLVKPGQTTVVIQYYSLSRFF